MGKKIFDLYGVEASSLDDAKLIIEKALDMKFNLHDSSYWGGDYYLSKTNHFEELKLIINRNELEKEWFEPDFQHIPFILYVDNTDRSNLLKNLLETTGHISQLRHEEI